MQQPDRLALGDQWADDVRAEAQRLGQRPRSADPALVHGHDLDPPPEGNLGLEQRVGEPDRAFPQRTYRVVGATVTGRRPQCERHQSVTRDLADQNPFKLRAHPELTRGTGQDPVGRAELTEHPDCIPGSLERVRPPDVLELAQLALECSSATSVRSSDARAESVPEPASVPGLAPAIATNRRARRADQRETRRRSSSS